MAAVADVRRAREGPREARMATERMDEGDQRSGPEPENSSTSPPPDDLSSANPAVAADPAKETGASDSGCIDSTENHSSSQDQEGAVEDAGEAAARGQEHDHAQLDGQDLVREPAPGQSLVLHNTPQGEVGQGTEEKGEPSKNPGGGEEALVPGLEEEEGRVLQAEDAVDGAEEAAEEEHIRERSPEVPGIEDCLRSEGGAELLQVEDQRQELHRGGGQVQGQGQAGALRRPMVPSLQLYLDDSVLSLAPRPGGVNQERQQGRPWPARSLRSINRRLEGLEMARPDLRGDRTLRHLLLERVQRLEDLGRGRRSERLREREAREAGRGNGQQPQVSLA